MPTYDYRCRNCDYSGEVFQPITAKPLRKCPSCGKRTLERLIGAGAGFLFHGSGFYETDYRSASYKEGAQKDQSPLPKESAGKAAPSKDKAESNGKSSGGKKAMKAAG